MKESEDMKTANKIMRHTYVMCMLCMAVALTVSCDKDAHDGESGLAAGLSWGDGDDAGTQMGKIHLWIFSTSGTLVSEDTFNNPVELSAILIDLAPGDYTLVAAGNLGDNFNVTGGSLSGLALSLKDAGASPEHAYYGATNISVPSSGTAVADIAMNRVLSEVTVTLSGAPAGATLSAAVLNAADGILPGVKNADGRYGEATDGGKNTVTIPTATTQGSAITTQTVRLMPTVSSASDTYLHFKITLADGTVLECDADAPAMTPSGKYILTMDYASLRAHMRLEAVTISDWTEGWHISGEVVNPI